MSISKIKTLQGKISKKFHVYTSFQCQQGFRKGPKGGSTFYTKVSVYDEVHSHREHATFKKTVESLEYYLALTEDQFKYETAKEKAEYELSRQKQFLEDAVDEIANLEVIIRKIELKENI